MPNEAKRTKALLLNAEGRREMGEMCMQSGGRMQSSLAEAALMGRMDWHHVGMANLGVDMMELTVYKYSATQ